MSGWARAAGDCRQCTGRRIDRREGCRMADNGSILVTGAAGQLGIAPQKADSLPALEARLTGQNLAAWAGKLQKRSVNVALPRFKLETDYELNKMLEKMGMKLAFTPRVADFTGMSTSSDPDDRLYISKVLHKAFVEVNEEGS